MIRRLTIAALLLAGCLLLLQGTLNWLQKREAAGVVHRLMAALKKGDRAAFYSLLPPGHPALLESAEGSPAGIEWSADPTFDYEIFEVEVSGNAARAVVKMTRQDFQIKPTIHLRRSPTFRWKITAVEDLQVDPRWYDLLRVAARTEGRQTARELERLLEGEEGVAVQRVAVPVDDGSL